MGLQTSGQISLNEIHVEAGGTSGTECSFNDTDIRDLISASSGAEMETKTCSKCKREKPLTQFSKDKSKKDGHKYVCKLCAKVRDKAYREANREELNAKKITWAQTENGYWSMRKAAWRKMLINP